MLADEPPLSKQLLQEVSDVPARLVSPVLAAFRDKFERMHPSPPTEKVRSLCVQVHHLCYFKLGFLFYSSLNKSGGKRPLTIRRFGCSHMRLIIYNHMCSTGIKLV